MKETFEKSLHSGNPVLAAFISAGEKSEVQIEEITEKVKEKLGDKVEYVVGDCAIHRPLRKKY